MLSTKILASASVFAKLVSGSGVFIITGYFVSPESLGRLSVYFAYATLMALVSDYGLQNPALRAVAIDKVEGPKVLNEYILFRVVLSLPVCLAGIVLLKVSGAISYTDLPFFLCILITTFVSSHADFIQIYFRGVGKYSVEAWIALLTGFLHLALVGVVAYKYRSIEIIGLAMLGSRIFYYFLSLVLARRDAPLFHWSSSELRSGIRRFISDIKSKRYYAADSIITASFSQIDILFINHFFGLHMSGVYQLASKVIQISLAMIQVFSSTYVPIFSRNLNGATRDMMAASRNLRRATLELLLAGSCFALGMIFVLPPLLHAVFGNKFAEVNVLWLGSGIAVIGRCLAAPFGITLIAMDKPGSRTLGQIFITTVYSSLAFLVFPNFGFMHVASVMAISLWCAAIFYIVCTYMVAPALMKSAFFARFSSSAIAPPVHEP